MYDTAYMLWYTREASVAVYVANLPGIWPLLREHVRWFQSKVSYPTGSAPLPSRAWQYGQGSTAHRSRRTTRNAAADAEEDIELGTRFSKTHSRSTRSMDASQARSADTRAGSLESDELALNGPKGSGWGMANLEVHVDKTIEVHEHRLSRDQSRGLGMGVLGNDAPMTKIEGPEGEVVNKGTQ